MTRAAWLGAALALATVARAGPAAPSPSPEELRALAARMVPRALVEGFVDGLAADAADRAAARVARAREAEVRARARAAAEAAARRALPESALVDFAAGLLARHYDAAEVRALLAWERSPVARKAEDYRREAAAIDARLRGAPDTAAREKAALARRTFTEAEQRDAEAFAASPLGRKSARLSPELTGAYLEFLERRLQPERPAIDAAVADAAAAATADAPEAGAPATR